MLQMSGILMSHKATHPTTHPPSFTATIRCSFYHDAPIGQVFEPRGFQHSPDQTGHQGHDGLTAEGWQIDDVPAHMWTIAYPVGDARNGEATATGGSEESEPVPNHEG